MSRIFEFATNILNKSNLRFTTRVCGSAILSCFNYNWGIIKKLQVSVADPGFPRRGAIPKREGTTYYFYHFFLKTAYKMKKNGLGCVQMCSCKYVSKETLVICLNLSICFSIWMVVKDFLWLSTSESGWSLEVFTSIKPCIVNIYIEFGWWRKVFRDHSTCWPMLKLMRITCGDWERHRDSFFGLSWILIPITFHGKTKVFSM